MLAWITLETGRWQTFVANRVTQIQEAVPKAHWKFLRGKENAANCGIKGILPLSFLKCDVWFNFPEWLWKETVNKNFEEDIEVPMHDVIK